MGRQAVPVVTAPIQQLAAEDMAGMTREAALDALRKFARANRYDSAEFAGALDLIQQAADRPGTTIRVPTTAVARTQRIHALLDIITGSPGDTPGTGQVGTISVTHDLALRATGAQPGTHFEHRMHQDYCGIESVCTNASAVTA